MQRVDLEAVIYRNRVMDPEEYIVEAIENSDERSAELAFFSGSDAKTRAVGYAESRYRSHRFGREIEEDDRYALGRNVTVNRSSR